MKRKILCLRNVNVYDGISEENLIKATDKAVEDYFEKGHVFYRPQNPAKNVYVLKSGEVELYREENGKKIVIEVLGPGDTFGDFGVRTTHCARAVRRSFVCETPTEEFLNIVKIYPQIALNLMQVMAEKISYYEDKITEFSKSAEERILAELRRIKEKNSRKIWGKLFDIPLRISHKRLAEQIGLNRVTVTKLMGKLQSANKIEIDSETGVIEII